MNKEYLDHVVFVKESLQIWMSNVEQMHNGIQMFSNENDLDRQNTDFAKWYYKEGQTFSSFETFRALEPFYDKMYDLFLDYNTLRKQPVKKGLFSNNVEKRKKELQTLYSTLRQSARQLIKSVEIFEDNLKTSPLFIDYSVEIKEEKTSDELVDNHKELVQSVNKEETSVEQINQESINEEKTAVEKPIEPVIKTEESSTEKKFLNKTDFDFEKRLQEEVERIKEQLKKELLEEQKIKEETGIIDSEQKEGESQKNQLQPKTKSNTQTPDLDIDEEIRRILS